MISFKTIAATTFAALLLSTSLAHAVVRSTVYIDSSRTSAAASFGDEAPASKAPGMERTQTDLLLPPLTDTKPPVSKGDVNLFTPTLDTSPKVEPKASPSEIITAGGLKLTPHAIKCWITDNGWVWFKNVGTETIPEGSLMVVKWPDGTKTTFKVFTDIKPGAGIDIHVPPSVLAATDGTHCSASIKLQP